MNILLVFNFTPEYCCLYYFKDVDQDFHDLVVSCQGLYINSEHEEKYTHAAIEFMTAVASREHENNLVYSDDSNLPSEVFKPENCTVVVGGFVL